MNNSKAWFKSKTVWLGVLMVIAAAVEYLAGLPTGTSVLQAISGVLTIIVRLITNTAIGTPGPTTPPGG